MPGRARRQSWLVGSSLIRTRVAVSLSRAAQAPALLAPIPRGGGVGRILPQSIQAHDRVAVDEPGITGSLFKTDFDDIAAIRRMTGNAKSKIGAGCRRLQNLSPISTGRESEGAGAGATSIAREAFARAVAASRRSARSRVWMGLSIANPSRST
jgi:hypothetical protein